MRGGGTGGILVPAEESTLAFVRTKGGSDIDGILLLPFCLQVVLMTESMLYTMMAFQTGPRCGTEISACVEGLTKGRVQLGPGTLYTILSRFLETGYLREVSTEGRKRTYALTEEGRRAYAAELARLRSCLRDAEAAVLLPAEGGDSHEGEGPYLPPAPLPAL